MKTSDEVTSPEHELRAAVLTHPGKRTENEDYCAVWTEGSDKVVIGVADGVSSYPGGEVASQMAIEAMLESYREAAPSLASGIRLYHAVQKANIAIYDRAVAVPELRGMATTLTAVTIDRGELTGVHVGDSRLYLVRGETITQLTKDHTVAAARARIGLVSREALRDHPDRCVLTRSLGRELIVPRDRFSRRVFRGDVLVLCTDGLYGVLRDDEIRGVVMACDDAAGACRTLIAQANAIGSDDNLSVGVVVIKEGRMSDDYPSGGLGARVRRLIRRAE